MYTLMIVDDHHVIRDTLRRWLRDKIPGINILEASSGEDASRLFESNPVDLVLMDIHLPRMSGIETIKLLKKKCPDLKVIVLSVQEDKRYRANAMKAGADEYVIKREMYSQLIPSIEKLLPTSTMTT